ncbi:MAG: tyrosine-type recombinase/integrase [Deltaproteobacteria bacterium]|nr:tyrosine-type recombinase/integrase [Deltaproteobacteria bacterium]
MEKYSFSGVYNTFSSESHHKDHPLYINLKPYLQDFPKTDKPIPAFNGRKRRGLDPDDVKKLLGVVKDIRDRAMVLVLLRTGMRIGELLNTLVSEVNLKERKIEVYEAEKTRVGRVVYIIDDAIAALKAWLRKRDSKYEYFFYGRGGNPLTYAAARNRSQMCLEKAGLSHKGYSPHCLRHTFATELLNADMRLECLQPLLGHSSIEMTRRYARLTDKRREEEYFRAMSKIEGGGGGGGFDSESQMNSKFNGY